MKGSIMKRKQTAIISIVHSLMMEDQQMKMYEFMNSILDNAELACPHNSNAQ